jgi:hypothetical protein
MYEVGWPPQLHKRVSDFVKFGQFSNFQGRYITTQMIRFDLGDEWVCVGRLWKGTDKEKRRFFETDLHKC